MFLPLSRYFQITHKFFGPEWRGTLTASKIPAFLHVDEHSSAIEQAKRVFGGAKSPPTKSDFQQNALDHGNNTEALAKEAIKSHDIPSFRRFKFRPNDQDGGQSYTAVYRCTESNLLFKFSATPDMILDYEMKTTSNLFAGEHYYPVEIKCPYYNYIKGISWDPKVLRPAYWVQLMVQCITLNANIGYLVIYIPFAQPRGPQLIVWRLFATDDAQKFVLGAIRDTYLKSIDDPQDTEFKRFRAKKGQRKQMTEKIEQYIRTNCQIIYQTPTKELPQ